MKAEGEVYDDLSKLRLGNLRTRSVKIVDECYKISSMWQGVKKWTVAPNLIPPVSSSPPPILGGLTNPPNPAALVGQPSGF